MAYSPMEARAAAAAAHVLDARAIPRDTGGRSIRDFDLLLSDGTIEPLEITLAANQVARQTSARIDALDREARTLARAWTLSVPMSISDKQGTTSPFAARDFVSMAEPLLRELELAGVTEFDTARWLGGAHPAIPQLVGLGCDLGISREVAAGETGRISLSSGSGGFVDVNALALAIEAEASKGDNRQKLELPAVAARRHLFTVIDGSSSDAFYAATHGELGRTPELPHPITTAWAAASESVHVVTPPSGWDTHVIPEDVFNHPERWIVS